MKFVHWLLVVGACVAVAAGLGWYKFQQIQAAIAFGKSFPERVEAVELYVVEQAPWRPVLDVTGDVRAIRTVDIAAELGGRIVKVGVQPGAQVKAGALLVQLDTSEEQAMLAAAQAQARLAQLTLSRNEKLIASRVTTEDARDQARAQFDAASAQVQQLQAIIAKKTLRAPFDAVAGLHQLEPGQFLAANTVVVRLVGLDPTIWVDFTLPQDRADLAIGAVVQVLPQRAGATPVDASVIARDVNVNERSRNVRFRAAVDNTAVGLVGGSLVTVNVPLGPERMVARVPTGAVRRDTTGPRVFVLRPAEEGAPAPERAELRAVTLGPQVGEWLLITDGLAPGDRVAANGAFKLRDGVLVRASAPVPGPDGPPATPGGTGAIAGSH